MRKKQPFFRIFILILIQFMFFSKPLASRDYNKYFERADEALLAGNFQKAITNYLKGINYADKKYISKVWDDLGYAYLQQGKYVEAINYLKNSISAYPENFNARLYLAAAYIQINELNAASQELDQIEKNIYFDNSWLSQAEGMLVTNEDGDEVTRYEMERLWKEKGIYLHKAPEDSGSEKRAVLYIDAFNETNKQSLHLMREHILKKRDDEEKVEEKSEIKFKIQHRLKDHDNSLLGPKLQQSLDKIENGEISESIKTLEEAMLINEKSFTINHNLALLYFDECQIDQERRDALEKAEIYCARALWFRKYQTTDKEEIIGCYDLMANIYSLKMEYEKSLREFKKILEFDPKNAHAYYNLGIVYFNIRDFQNAESEWQMAIDLEERAQIPEEEKDIQGDKMEHSVTVRKRSICHMSHLALGRLYAKQQRLEEAIAELELAISITPNAADPHLLLAKVYQKIGTRDKAVFHLERYLFLGGKEKEEAKELLRQLKSPNDSD